MVNELDGATYTVNRTIDVPSGGGRLEQRTVEVVQDGSTQLRQMSFDPSDVSFDFLMLVVLAVSFRVAALLILYLRQALAVASARRNAKLLDARTARATDAARGLAPAPASSTTTQIA